MEVENNPEASSSDHPTTEDTTAVTQEDPPKTNGEATPETLAMPSPAKARCVHGQTSRSTLHALLLYCRYDWYQTETDVIIAIMVKNASPNDVQIDFTEKTVQDAGAIVNHHYTY